jgi:hypothetical protein
LAGAGQAAASGEILSINFANGVYVTSGSAGAILVDHSGWNNVGATTGNTGVDYVATKKYGDGGDSFNYGNGSSETYLRDNFGGTLSTANVTFQNIAISYTTSGSTATGNGQLFSRLIFKGASALADLPAFTLGGLSGFSEWGYDVYVMQAMNGNAVGNSPSLKINDADVYTSKTAGVTVRDDALDLTANNSWFAHGNPNRTGALLEGVGGNYLRFTNLTGDVFKATAGRNGSSTNNGCFIGVQVQTYSVLEWNGGDATWDADTALSWKKDGSGPARAWKLTDANTGAAVAGTWNDSNQGGRVAKFAGSAAVTVDGTQDVDGFHVTGGTVTLSGGVLHLGHGVNNITGYSAGETQANNRAKFVIDSGARLQIASTLAGTEHIEKSGDGELLLGAAALDDRLTVTAGAFGVISDGTYATTLTLSNGLDMVSGSTLKMVLGGDGTDTTLDLSNVSSTLDDVTLEVEGSGRLIVAGVHVSNYAHVNAWASTVGLNHGVATWNDGNYIATVAAIPEPSTYALLGGVGAVALALLRRRRRA